MASNVRQSRRNLGEAPEYGELLTDRRQRSVPTGDSESTVSEISFNSAKTSNSVNRRKIQAQLKALEETAKIQAEELALEKKRLQQQKALQEKKLQLELSLLDEDENQQDDDNDSQHLSDDEDESNEKQIDKVQLNEKQADKGQPNEKEVDVACLPNEKHVDVECDYNDKQDNESLTQSEKDEMDKWLNIPNQQSNVSEQSPEKETTELPVEKATSTIEQMVQAITTAFTNVSNQSKPNDNEMKKFVARQATSKDLPLFFGDPEDWPTFISEFRGATEDCGFTNRENMARLRKSLRGKAKDAVSSMMVSPENVNQVIETLETSFGRPDLIIATLIVKAKKLPNPKEDRIESIIEYSNAVQNLVTTMKTLKKTAHMTNPQLMTDLVEKLPASVKMQWALKIGSIEHEPTLEDLSDWLKRFAKAMSVVSAPKVLFDNSKQRENRNTRKWNSNERDVVCTTSESSEKNTAPECKFCKKKGHAIVDCRNFIKEPVTKKWDVAKENYLCFVCLQEGHGTANCKNKKKCGKEGCDSLHHRLLHRNRPSATTVSEVKTEHVNLSYPPKLEKTVLLRVLPVKLHGPAGEISTFAILDSASTTTIIDTKTADQLGLVGKKEMVKLKWLKEEPRTEECRIVDLKISDADGRSQFYLNRVKTIDNLQLPVQTVKTSELAKLWKHVLKGKAHSFENAQPTILVGEDHADLTLVRETYQGPRTAPILSRTKLGWVVHGPQNPFKGRVDCDYALHIFTNEKDDMLHQLIKESFKTDAFGVKVVENLPESKADTRAKRILEETTRRVGEHWETGLLWRKDDFKFPESKVNAISRLEKMERKMERNPEFEKLYRMKIDEYLEKGYARRLTTDEAAISHDRTFYIPHFAVSNPHKPGKIRFVFDAASKSRGVSFNDALLPGPDLLSPLINVLLVFRQHLIGFTGDICEMFHQVFIRKEDRSSQRFLWRENRNEPPEVLEMSVMTFGSTSSPCSAQFVKNKNAAEFQDEFPEAYLAITKRHYVDDYLDSRDTEEGAIKMLTDVSELHRRGGFHIRNFCCSSKKVLEHFGATAQEQSKSFNEVSPQEEPFPTWAMAGNVTRVPCGKGKICGISVGPVSNPYVFLMTFSAIAH